jgi:hypothetical protein
MGGNASQPQTNLLYSDLHFQKLHLRAQEAGIAITLQGDGSLSLQNVKQKNLAKDVRNISGPIDKTDVPRVLKEITTVLEEMTQSTTHYGYQ